MSLVPILFRDWWEELEHLEKERPVSRLLNQHFGIGLKKDDLLSNWSLSTPLIKPGKYFRPWKELVPRQNSGSSLIKAGEKAFEAVLDVQQFAPGEITAKVADGAVIVEGKHEEKPDEHGFVSRHFVRRYVPPVEEVDLEKVVLSLSSDGVLTISIPKKSTQPDGEKIVPIIQTGTPAAKTIQTGNPGPKTIQTGNPGPKTTQNGNPAPQQACNETQIKIEQEPK